MEQKLKELKSEVKSLLEEYPQGINFNSFWGLYERKYHRLPELKAFKVKKRSEILERCSDVYRKVGLGGTAVIHLKSDHCNPQPQRHTSTAAAAAEGMRLQSSVQSPPMQAGLNQFNAGGSFYQRFYSESANDSDSTASTHHVTNSAPRGSYTSLIGTYSRPATLAVRPPAAASYPQTRFARPSLPCWNTPPVASSLAFNQTPSSRDSSASRSSDGARNQSPAPGVRLSGPTPLMAVDRLPAQVSMTGNGVTTGRGRRMTYSREQLNSAAEDCIDRLSVAKDYVSLERISLLLCQDFEVSSLDELGLRQIDDLHCVNEHKRLECKVNAYIQNFVKVFLFSYKLSIVKFETHFHMT